MGRLSYNIVFYYSNSKDLEPLNVAKGEKKAASMAVCIANRTKETSRNNYLMIVPCATSDEGKLIQKFVKQIREDTTVRLVSSKGWVKKVQAPSVVILPYSLACYVSSASSIVISDIESVKYIQTLTKLGSDNEKDMTIIVSKCQHNISTIDDETLELTKEIIKAGSKNCPRIEGEILYAAGDNSISMQTSDTNVREIDRTLFLLRLMARIKTRETIFKIGVEYVTRHNNPDELLEGALGGPVKYLFLTGKLNNEYKWVMAEENESPIDTWKSNLKLASIAINQKSSIPSDMLSWLKYQLHSREDCRDFMSCPVLRCIWDDFMSAHAGSGSIFVGQEKSFNVTLDKCKKVINGVDKNDEEIDEITDLDAWLTKQYYDYKTRRGVMANQSFRKTWENWFGDGDKIIESIQKQFYSIGD